MTITVKRSCESNIRNEPGKLQFNSFTVSFTGPELRKFNEILERTHTPTIKAAVLEWILYRGLDAQLENIEQIDGLYKEVYE